MNWFDLIVLFVLILAFISGYSKGAIKMLISLAIIIFSIVFGGKISSIILPYIDSVGLSNNVINVMTYIIAVLSIAIILTLIGNIIQKLINIINLGLINKIIGGVISMGVNMVIMSLILNSIIVIDKKNNLISEKSMSESFFYERVQSVVPAISPYINFDSLNYNN